MILAKETLASSSVTSLSLVPCYRATSPAPPSYSHAIAERCVPESGRPFGAPTNFVRVIDHNAFMAGSWTIDTSYPDLSAFDNGSSGGPERLSNLFLSSHASGIVADVRVYGACSQLARLHASSYYGTVRVNLHERSGQRVHVHASSQYGTVIVKIPLDFAGVIHNKSHHGSLRCSPAVKACLTTYSSIKEDGYYFIGDITKAYRWNEEVWECDQVELQSYYGDVKVLFIHENNPREVSAASCSTHGWSGLFD